MQLVLAFILIIGLVCGQQLTSNDTEIIKEGFPQSPVTTVATTVASMDKCGEGKTKGKGICVNFEYCDIVTNTTGDRPTDTRFRDSKCDDPLEVCCQITDVTPTLKPKTTLTSKINTTTTKPSSSSNRCGRRIDSQIIRNIRNEAEYGEFPWMVGIMKRKMSSYELGLSICGGSLISPSMVMTAAHCVDEYKADDLKIRVREWESEVYTERLPYQEKNVAKIIIHEDFVRAHLFNDVALLVLDSPFKGKHINTVCLPDQGEVIHSKHCFVSTWGKTVLGIKGPSQILNKVRAAIISEELSQRLTKFLDSFELNFTTHDSFLWTINERRVEHCMSYGGSPLVCPDPNEPFRYLLTGVVAWELNCAKDYIPGVYADVAKFRSWVDDQMRRENISIDSYIY